MPRKSATSAAQGTALAKSALRSTAHSVTFQSFDRKEDLDEIQNDDDVGGSGARNGDEESMMEMLSILQEFQKRKATKTSTRSAAFQSKKNILFAEARRNVDAVVRDGVTFIEQCKAKVIELKAQEVSEDRHFKDLALLWKNHDESVRSLLGLYPSLTEDLSHRRADQINEASVMLEAHAAERQNSRRKLVRNAKAKMDDNLENQKIATDAHALIKHYKALLLS